VKTDNVRNENAETVLEFWFSAPARTHWFKAPRNFDAEIREKFGQLHTLASAGKLESWLLAPRSCLALVIVLDQFSRNLNRNDAKMYDNDRHARNAARYVIDQGFDQRLKDWEKAFVYMPFMHSESIDDQDLSVKLFTAAGLDNARYALHHRDIIRRFGRFPHRNRLLGRKSTREEQAY